MRPFMLLALDHTAVDHNLGSPTTTATDDLLSKTSFSLLQHSAYAALELEAMLRDTEESTNGRPENATFLQLLFIGTAPIVTSC